MEWISATPRPFHQPIFNLPCPDTTVELKLPRTLSVWLVFKPTAQGIIVSMVKRPIFRERLFSTPRMAYAPGAERHDYIYRPFFFRHLDGTRGGILIATPSSVADDLVVISIWAAASLRSPTGSGD